MYIDNTAITMIRGDTEELIFSLQDEEGNLVPLTPGYTVYFTVKKSTKMLPIVFQIIVTEFTDEGEAIIRIEHEDTKDLPEGEYVYDIQVTMNNGTVKTVIPPSLFVLLGDVTSN